MNLLFIIATALLVPLLILHTLGWLQRHRAHALDAEQNTVEQVCFPSRQINSEQTLDTLKFGLDLGLL